ncbi:nuclear envelope pore membrane protein POM 121C-like [Orycteropus afer afer]|uniref:Nuclear envelope pore membrane protein POM 121C-like n=1 Tax=Orycteropus afer afer TaxID=1230840 RepID=A0A8B7AVK0_ORYAF|nr:nuclear envelope pore membrane protein POM 121C-like [Orycteropus afer afer]
MGSYLSRPPPPPLSPALKVRDPSQSPNPLRPAHLARGDRAACRVHSADATLGLSRRLSYEDRVALPCFRRRRHRRRFVIVYWKRYPNRLSQCSFLGIIPSAPQRGHQKKLALSVCSSKMFCTSVILKLAPSEDKLTLRLALKQTVVCMWSSLSSHFPSPYVKEILLRAFGESSEVRAQEEEDQKALGEIGKWPVKQEENDIITERRGSQRRGLDDGEGVQSAFRPVIINGIFPSFIPKPGPLKRDLLSSSSEYGLIKTTQASFMSSCRKRNAITSSYSSTRAFPLLQRRSGPSKARLSGPAIFHSQVPAEKVSEEGHQSNSLASLVPEKKIPGENILDATSGQKQHLGNCSSMPHSSRSQKRKVPLLLSNRRGEPLIMPPAPQIGYQVTIEDFDLEKKAAIQWINEILKGKPAGPHSLPDLPPCLVLGLLLHHHLL